MIEFECPHCGYRLTVESAHAGRHAWCRRCKRIAIVPAYLMAVAPPGETPSRDIVSGSPRPTDLSAASAKTTSPEPLVDSTVSTSRATLEEGRRQSDKVNRLNVLLVEKSATIDRLSRELKRTKTSLSQREREVEQFREYADKVRLRIRELEKSASNRATTDEAQHREIDRLREDLEAGEERILALETELENTRQVAATAERLAEEVKTVHGDAVSKEQALREYEQAVDSRNTAIEEGRHRIEAQDAQIRELRAEVERTRDELTSRTHDLDESLGLIEELRNRESEQARAIETLSSQLEDRERSESSVRNEMKVLYSEVETLEGKLRETQDNVEVKTAGIDQLTGELTSAQESLAAGEEDKARLSQKLDRLRSTRERDQEQIAALSAELDQVRLASNDGELDALRTENASLRQQLDEFRRGAETSLARTIDDSADATTRDASSREYLLPDVGRPEEDDQRMLVEALLRFLGRQ